MSSVKPIKTERTHEENQERAYIAASRRSDRSLEARVESARRASEIHKRRTGRALRVTEQDVVNEEMYEEEDEGLPRQLSRLTAHLNTGDHAFDYRVNAMLTQQFYMRAAMQAGGFNMGMGQGQMFGGQPNGAMNPSMMQMPQQGFHQRQPQQQMMPPQAFHRSSMNHRQAPYPNANYVQSMRSQMHNRSASLAAPQEYIQRQQSHVGQMSSPTNSIKAEDRRMSLPAQSLPQTPQSQHVYSSPLASRHGSSSNLPTPHAYFKQEQSPHQQMPSPREYQQPQPQRPQPFAFNQHQSPADNVSPLSMTLPLNAAQMLGDGPAAQDSTLSMMMPQPQQAYKYNPNGKPRNSPSRIQQGLGLQSTLGMGPTLDTSFNAFDNDGFVTSPESAGTDNLITPQSNFIFGGGLDDNIFSMDPSKLSSGTVSEEQTPGYDSGLFDFEQFGSDNFFDNAAGA